MNENQKKNNPDVITMQGIVTEVLPNTTFSVKLENEKTIFCHISGKIRKHRIKIIINDKVTVEISKYDITKGRIILRSK